MLMTAKQSVCVFCSLGEHGIYGYIVTIIRMSHMIWKFIHRNISNLLCVNVNLSIEEKGRREKNEEKTRNDIRFVRKVFSSLSSAVGERKKIIIKWKETHI